jgi:hypothetical protein
VVWEQRYVWGRAYRNGRLVCSRVGVTVVSDVRIAPSPPVRRQVRVRFLEGVDKALRDELEQLVRTRGMHSRRLAEQSDLIEIVWDEPHGWRGGGRRSRVGRLEPPACRFAPLEEVGFSLREPAS